MKKITYILMITLLSSSLAFAQKKAKTPLALLKKIHKLASKKKYDKLKPYLYQGVINDGPAKVKGKTMGDLILMGMQKGNMGSDFSFNAEALKTLIDKHSERIIPITETLIEQLFGGEGKDFSQFTDLKRIADNNPNDLYIFDHGGVHILIAKIDGGFKLVFWDGLKSFGKKENGKSTEPKKPDGGE